MLISNKKHGDFESPFADHDEAISKLLATTGDEHWLWYWIHKTAAEAIKAPGLKNALVNISYLFLYAIGNGLKRPRIRVRCDEYRYQLYLSRRGTLCVRAARVKEGCDNDYDPEEYVGCIYDGRFLPNKIREPTATDQRFIDTLAGPDVIMALAVWSKDLGTCCYCNMPLDDPRSKTVGYGQTCAKRWGLPWGNDVDPEKAPSFFRLLRDEPDLTGLMIEIGENPYSDDRWGVLRDWLIEHGVKGICKPPATGTVLPNVLEGVG